MIIITVGLDAEVLRWLAGCLVSRRPPDRFTFLSSPVVATQGEPVRVAVSSSEYEALTLTGRPVV